MVLGLGLGFVLVLLLVPGCNERPQATLSLSPASPQTFGAPPTGLPPPGAALRQETGLPAGLLPIVLPHIEAAAQRRV